MTDLLVVYCLRSSGGDGGFHNRTVQIPDQTPAHEIEMTVKELVHPKRNADREDGLMGQDPRDVQIINLVNLNTIL